jgi:cytidine deaminase
MDGQIVAPCGSCRQFIAEFGLDITIVMVNSNGEHQICKLRDILPFAFDKNMIDTKPEIKSSL